MSLLNQPVPRSQIYRSELVCLFFLLCLFQLPGRAQSASVASADRPRLRNSELRTMDRLPLAFEGNQGQVNAKVRYFARGRGYSLYLTDAAAVFAFKKASSKDPASGVLRMELLGGEPGQIHATETLRGTANYFLGKNPAKWRSGVPTFARVEYDNIYPGVNLAYYGSNKALEYDFVVAPYADAGNIRMRFNGARHLSLQSDGDLEVRLKDGSVVFHKPVLYQAGPDGQRETVEGRFLKSAEDTIAFQIGRYDRSRTLVIDPQLAYSSYIGGTTGGGAEGPIAVDSQGQVYVVGETTATDFPVTSGVVQGQNPGQGENGVATTCLTITKFSPDFSRVVYSTYLGGTTGNNLSNGANDLAGAITVDAVGNAYIAGATYSTDYPTTAGALQSTDKGAANTTANAFLTKLSPDGSSLVFSTYLGGSGNPQYYYYSVFPNNVPGGDAATGIAFDSQGNILLSGATYSADFPVTTGAYQTQHKSASSGRPTSFLAKINPTGSQLLFSTFLGGTGEDVTAGVVLDAADNIYLAGSTSSTDFPVTGGVLQSQNNGAASGAPNVFVSKFNPSGSQLLFSTYLGGSGFAGDAPVISGDVPFGLALDAEGNIVVSGVTESNNFPVTSGAFQTVNKSYGGLTTYAGFVSKLNPTATSLLFSTYLAGSIVTSLGNPVIDRDGHIFVSGYSAGNDFPVTSDAYQSVNRGYHTTTINGVTLPAGGTNVILTQLSSSGDLMYSTYLGGSGYTPNQLEWLGDTGGSIAIDAAGNVYLAGQTESSDFPVTSSAIQKQQPAQSSGFVAKMIFTNASVVQTTTKVTADANPQDVGKSVHFTISVHSSDDSVPAGSVALNVDGNAAATLPLNNSGEATYAASQLAAGDHTVTAMYAGDLVHASSSGTLIESITAAAAVPASISAISGSNQTSVQGTAFAAPLVARVTDSTGAPVSGVAVTFAGVGLAFGSATVTTDTNGIVSNQATPQASGTLTATASVSGLSTKATFILTGTAPQSPTFSLNLSSTTLTVKQGQTGSLTLTMNSQGGYQGTISFNCPTVPTNASCSFTPSQVALSTSQTTADTTLTIGTGSTNTAQLQADRRSSVRPISIALVTVPGMLGLFFMRRKEGMNWRSTVFRVVALFFIGTSAMLSGCGGSKSSAGSGGGNTGGTETSSGVTPMGQYTVPVNVMGSGLPSSVVNVTLIVQ